MVFWPSGHPDFWPSGLLAIWSSGHPAIWSSGHLTIWSSSLLVIWSSRLLAIWSSDHLVIRSSDHTDFWSSGHLVFWPSVLMPQKCPYWNIFDQPNCRLHQSQIPNVLPANPNPDVTFLLLMTIWHFMVQSSNGKPKDYTLTYILLLPACLTHNELILNQKVQIYKLSKLK